VYVEELTTDHPLIPYTDSGHRTVASHPQLTMSMLDKLWQTSKQTCTPNNEKPIVQGVVYIIPNQFNFWHLTRSFMHMYVY